MGGMYWVVGVGQHCSSRHSLARDRDGSGRFSKYDKLYLFFLCFFFTVKSLESVTVSFHNM